MTHDSAAERDAAGTALLHETFVRWRDLPPARFTLDRVTAWTTMLALQVAATHPGFAASSWGPAVVTVGRQIQDAAADTPEVHAAAERNWTVHDTGAPSGDPAADEAGIRLMTDAYARWQTMAPVTVTAERIDTFAVLMALQLVVAAHPTFGPDAPMGPAVTAVGRQIQERLCDTAELYALAEAGWNRAYDVEQDGHDR
ncbi:hypothetical protein ACWC9H_27220 [Streptomyces sp. NPDC001251]